MGSGYVLSFHPTFTQGLILGQLSVLVLLALILRYLFLDSTVSPFETSSYHPGVDNDLLLKRRRAFWHETEGENADKLLESADWFSLLLKQVVDTYRSQLRDHLTGVEGDEIARRKIEDYANLIRPPGFLDHVKIHSIDLGSSAPRLYNARVEREKATDAHSVTKFDLHYTDTISLSLSTSHLFNYPMPSFARLPVSLTIALSLFKSSITITPPLPTSPTPVLTVSISPDFTLELMTTSLMGSRAKLANVPKLHELIQHQLRRILAARATWKIPLPGMPIIPAHPMFEPENKDVLR